MANLIGTQVDGERLREMLVALEAKQRLVELLNAYIDSRQESVRVVFDLEEQAPEMAGLVLIAAPARMAWREPGDDRGHRKHADGLREHDERGELSVAGLRPDRAASKRVAGTRDSGLRDRR